MKCRRVETFEYCPVAYILWGRPDLNPEFKGFQKWVHKAFKDGMLKIDQDEGILMLLEIRGDMNILIGNKDFVVRGEDGVVFVEDERDFNRRYEIID